MLFFSLQKMNCSARLSGKLTLLVLFVLCQSLCADKADGGQSWASCRAAPSSCWMVGLGLYSIILFFVGGIGKAMRGEKHFSGSEKLIYGYLGVVWVLIVLISIYLMAHN